MPSMSELIDESPKPGVPSRVSRSLGGVGSSVKSGTASSGVSSVDVADVASRRAECVDIVASAVGVETAVLGDDLVQRGVDIACHRGGVAAHVDVGALSSQANRSAPFSRIRSCT